MDFLCLSIFLANTGHDKKYTFKFSANADKWFSLLHFDHEMEEAETERVEDNSSLIELDIFWWKLKRKVVKINIFTFLQMSEARHLFIWNKGYNFTRHPTIKAYQASISPCRPQSGRGVLCGEEDYSFSGQTAFIHLLYHIIACTSLYIHRVGWWMPLQHWQKSIERNSYFHQIVPLHFAW